MLFRSSLIRFKSMSRTDLPVVVPPEPLLFLITRISLTQSLGRDCFVPETNATFAVTAAESGLCSETALIPSLRACSFCDNEYTTSFGSFVIVLTVFKIALHSMIIHPLLRWLWQYLGLLWHHSPNTVNTHAPLPLPTWLCVGLCLCFAYRWQQWPSCL